MPDGRDKNVRLTNVVFVKPENGCQTSQDSGLNAYSDTSSDGTPTTRTTKSGPIHFVADSKEAQSEKYSITVIGSGEFGRSLAMKIAKSGYGVNIGSRNPERCR